jgi:hypothetical protein
MPRDSPHVYDVARAEHDVSLIRDHDQVTGAVDVTR